MEMNLNFKRVDINAFTLKEAQEILKDKANFEQFANATSAWKNAGSPMQNTREFKEFCASYLADKTKNKQGLGCVIVYEPGKADTRERPYELTDVVNEQGTYWVANNFIWGWLVLPITQLAELIKNQPGDALKERLKTAKTAWDDLLNSRKAEEKGS